MNLDEHQTLKPKKVKDTKGEHKRIDTFIYDGEILVPFLSFYFQGDSNDLFTIFLIQIFF